MRWFPALCLGLLLAGAACEEIVGPDPEPTPGPPPACDGDGAGCVGRCCDEGFSCQRGSCVDAADDADSDGYPAYQDCDDYDNNTYPGAMELCDDRDNNCNGVADEEVRDEHGACRGLCEDLDGDGVLSCDGDCDDHDPEVYPGAEEICDGKDNDCNGESDDGFDEDGDGYGACETGGDCNDDNPWVAPGFVEVCDGVDNDCSGDVDDGDVCGVLGRCLGAEGCFWDFPADSELVEHECGRADGRGGWCAASGDPVNKVLVSAPARGMDDMPYGIYSAYFVAKVSDNSTSWGDCGTALRLRVNDRDGDGTGTCRDCYFGGDVALVPRHFETAGAYQEWELRLSIGPERAGHLIEVIAMRGSCATVEVCVEGITIGEI